MKTSIYLQHMSKAALAIGLVLLIVYRLLICINYNVEIAVGESNNIWNALKVAQGKPLYSNPEDTPFEIFQYTPVSQIPIIIASKIFNDNSPTYVYKVLLTGRSINLFFNLFTIYLVYLILGIFGVKSILRLSTTLLSFALLTQLSFAVRPDSCALFLMILSIYLFIKAYFKNKPNLFLVSGTILALSFFVKQDSFLIISALGLFLLLNRKWKETFTFSLSFIAPLAILLFLFKLSFGPYFLSSITGGVSTGYDFAQLKSVFIRFLDFYAIVFFIGLVFFITNILKYTSKKSNLLLLLLYIFSLLIALFSSLKKGSWINYYNPFVIYSLILIAVTLSQNKIHEKKYSSPIISGITLGLMCLFLFQQTYHYTSPFLKYSKSKSDYLNLVDSFKDFKNEAEAKGYNIFTFDKPLKLLFSKHSIFPNTEFYHVTQFSLDGYKNLREDQQLDVLIKNKDLEKHNQFSTLEYFKVPTQNFKETDKILNYTIYKNGR